VNTTNLDLVRKWQRDLAMQALLGCLCLMDIGAGLAESSRGAFDSRLAVGIWIATMAVFGSFAAFLVVCRRVALLRGHDPEALSSVSFIIVVVLFITLLGNMHLIERVTGLHWWQAMPLIGYGVGILPILLRRQRCTSLNSTN